MSISLNPTAPEALASNVAETAAMQKPGAGNSAKSEKAHAAIEKFEGLFMSMMIKQLRETGSGEGLFPGDASDTYGGMFDMFLGDHLAASGDIGLERLFRSSVAIRQLEDYTQRKPGVNPQVLSKGIEEYRNEQFRSGAFTTLSAP